MDQLTDLWYQTKVMNVTYNYGSAPELATEKEGINFLLSSAMNQMMKPVEFYTRSNQEL